jgi:hypothetical protein
MTPHIQFCLSWLITEFLARVTLRVPIREQELFKLTEHLSSHRFCCEISCSSNLSCLFSVLLVFIWLLFWSFSFGISINYPLSFHGFWLCSNLFCSEFVSYCSLTVSYEEKPKTVMTSNFININKTNNHFWSQLNKDKKGSHAIWRLKSIAALSRWENSSLWWVDHSVSFVLNQYAEMIFSKSLLMKQLSTVKDIASHRDI